MTMEVLKIPLTVLIVIAAAVTDLKWRKVPNWLTIPALGVGLVMGVISGGTTGLLMSLAGIALALGFWIVTCLVGGTLGGGDIKLLAALGAIQGPRLLAYVFIISVGVGGVIAVATALYHRTLRASVQRLFRGLATMFISSMPTQIVNETGTIRFPYTPAIAVGTVAALFYLTNWGGG